MPILATVGIDPGEPAIIVIHWMEQHAAGP
jgi:hypothetical protein